MGSTSSNNNINPLQKEKKLKCSIYHNKGMREYMYKLDVNIPNLDPPEFIFIVDKSGSMGSTFNKIITRTIPEVLNSLGYGNRKIHLITFDNNVNYSNISQSELKKSRKVDKKRVGKVFITIIGILVALIIIALLIVLILKNIKSFS